MALKQKSSAGLFLEKYNYRGVQMVNMPEAKLRIHSLKDFNKIDYIPHVIFCIPNYNFENYYSTIYANFFKKVHK
ncbi:MAG: hypothetical protein WKF85_00560 [Chitinophagaceae bacterium]